MAADLRWLVEMESPSTEKAATDRLAAALAERLKSLGARTEIIDGGRFGNHVRAVIGNGPSQVLVLCHMDTVWPLGELARRPVRIEDGKLYGPGAFDMKAGIVDTLWAIRAINEFPVALEGTRVVFLYNSDEEVGSFSSRPHIEEEARRSQGVLVLEPSRPEDGGVKLWRKGVAQFTIRAGGRSSHAGSEPDEGVSAVHELCAQAQRLIALADRSTGTTVNIGVFRGGTRVNVVAAEAEFEVDYRAATDPEMDRVVAFTQALTPIGKGATLTVKGGVNRPPMPILPASQRLHATAERFAAELGFAIPAGGTGAGSDGNLTAHLGVPTLDGIGARGSGSHALHEHVVIDSLPERTALVVGLLTSIK
jgi:glutamate carboxypeptidase